ncbi:bacillithiol biosynthesis cysteine-adding enzyme BshC [Lacinutrix sp. C3R15]|uniref:bacillithiol biosynthesis cysteine-adding enzyme BshC n=1 Tax=Flavobacteriaceae TaxID=49546 RepID=UPI001C083CFE|nr:MULTISPECIES: bacillithiol biosynthesis cysteine-adding enzyme BshC [Flavobacteriaceae]MBU2939511.1 bacillithiol biosynthesis cysteine-adding enzyme BshC [Lacinutrix sp. C3R15]MDO6622826.1 bacillithiol biosynthesis cysteine-adding enzyme BshC [Oceanihabitans sp. 1_MG-2023]
MPTECITFKKTNYFSTLICDYLEEKKELQPFYNNFPKLENFKAQIEEKRQSEMVSVHNRNILAKAIKEQYKNIEASTKTLQNIENLKLENTFTITTGHQLNLFTGPLYFLYKIVSTINLASQLKQKYPDCNFVPIYWMATEDHDFDEINYFNFKGKKVQWNREASGAVGELSTQGLDKVFDVFTKELGAGKNADTLRDLFQSAYLKHNTLADATLYLANALFSAYGLVVVEANNKSLKQLFVPYIEEELLKQTSFNVVSKTNEKLSQLPNVNKIQVNPREINLFYLTKNLRERIVYEDQEYKVLNSNISFSKEEILQEVKENPQRFSPNVIMRPLYQEVILPNLCYIGGGGELAYWLQLKDNFKALQVPFPMLLLRNSVLIKTQKQADKLTKLHITNEDLFLKRDAFINKKVRQISNIDIDFSEQLKQLQQQFKDLYALAQKTDKSFIGAVAAQEKKQLNGLQHLEKRLLTAQKRKLKDQVARMTELQNQLFPNASLQERNTNFSELYLEFGEQLVPKLIEELKPLQGNFTILTM